MNIVFGIIIGLLILMALVTLHEFGHFIMARKNGVKVNEFGIGFPPRAIAWIKKPVEQKDKAGKPLLDDKGQAITKLKWCRLPKSEWGKPQDTLIFSLNWLPIGGFCAMDGESDADTKKGTFGAATFWGKTKILFGGVLMNWLVAFIILLVLAFTGMPQFLDHQFTIKSDETILDGFGVLISGVLKDSPAATAGLEPGQYIVATGATDDGPYDNSARETAGRQKLLYPSDVTSYIDDHLGQTAHFCIAGPDQPGNCEWHNIELNPEGSDYGLGVEMAFSQAHTRYTWSAPLVATGTTLQLTGETFKGLGELVWNLFSGVFRQFSFDATVREEGQAAIGTAGASVSGPVGIIGTIFPAFASSGAANLAFLAALISVSLACMNVLPIPALDGGRWLLIAIFRLRKKKLTKETEEKIVSRAFTVLLILIAVITVLDIIKLF